MSLPVLTVEQMRAWEKATWAAGGTEAEVIARVGKAVADKIREMMPGGGRVVLLAGKGNNGNDVRAVVPHLVPEATAPRPPSVLSPTADCPAFPAYEVTLLEITDPLEARPRLERLLANSPELVVDGLFGIGLNRALSAEWCCLIEAVNGSGLPVLAVDVPSGLDADSGGHFGAVIRADVTLTVGAPKCGLVSDGARESVGRLEVATEVGLLPDPEAVVGEASERCHEDGSRFPQAWTVAGDFAGLPPRRRVESHKGTYGHLVVLAGSLGYHGAAVLAARAAGAARPGLVTVITSPEAYPAVAAQLAFAMVQTWNEPMALPAKTSAVLIGPGLAGADVPERLRAQMMKWWRELPVPLVVDASALDWLAAEHRDWWAGFVSDTSDAGARLRGHHTWHHHAGPRVITPHPGEAARWFAEGKLPAVQDRFTAAAHLGRVSGIAVLKGHQTLVRGADEPTFINSTGNPGLAQGGTGDVLAGFLGGLLAQPALQHEPLLTTRYAVWEHGAAADRLEAVRRNWTAEDLAAEIGR
jgi:NAD(P)H-hydrate epimerase